MTDTPGSNCLEKISVAFVSRESLAASRLRLDASGGGETALALLVGPSFVPCSKPTGVESTVSTVSDSLFRVFICFWCRRVELAVSPAQGQDDLLLWALRGSQQPGMCVFILSRATPAIRWGPGVFMATSCLLSLGVRFIMLNVLWFVMVVVTVDVAIVFAVFLTRRSSAFSDHCNKTFH